MLKLHLEIIYEDEAVLIQIDKTLELLQLTFLQQPGIDQFRNGYRLAIDTATRKEIKFWLTDAIQIKKMNPENQGWLMENMGPLLKAKKILKLAIILSPECFIMTSPSKVYEKPEVTGQPKGGEIKMHFDFEPAYNWLFDSEKVY